MAQHTGKALLFDIDGTLANTDPLHLKAFNQVLGPRGHVFDHARFSKELQGFSNASIGQPHPLPYQEGLSFVGAAPNASIAFEDSAPAFNRPPRQAFRPSGYGRASAMLTLLAPARSRLRAHLTIRTCSRASPPPWRGEGRGFRPVNRDQLSH
jgi:hypothetical protein